MVKVVILYPHPKDKVKFERDYTQEHLPMAMEKLTTARKARLTTFTNAPDSTPTYYRMAEIYFDSMQELTDCLASPDGQETAAHAVKISSGGPPVFMIGEDNDVQVG